jgi:hypothetical protein
MANFLFLDKNYVQDGLGTLTLTVPATVLTPGGPVAVLNQIFYVKCQTTVTPPSSLVITVKQNGTTRYTAPAFTPTQSALEFNTDLIVAAADSITVNFTSSAAVDNQLNSIKSNVAVGQGEY